MKTTFIFPVPPATDQAGLLALIGNLLSARRIEGSTWSNENLESVINHPIPESKQLLLDKYMELDGFIKSVQIHDKLTFDSASSNGLMIILNFTITKLE